MLHKIIIDKTIPRFELPVFNGSFTQVILKSIRAATLPQDGMGYLRFWCYRADNHFSQKQQWGSAMIQAVSLPLRTREHFFGMDMLAMFREQAGTSGKGDTFNKLHIIPHSEFVGTGNSYEITLSLETDGSFVPMQPAHLF